MIRNIVFDMGKVLLKFDPDLFIRQAGVEDPEDAALIRRECHVGPSSPGARQQTYCLTWLIFVNPNFTNGLLSPPGPRL